MSTFGDGTPLQALLESAENVQMSFRLSNQEMVVLISHLLTHVVDSYDEELRNIQKKKDVYA